MSARDLGQEWLEQLPQGEGRGPAWLADLRSAGAAAFRHAGLPAPRDEDWKYTSLRALDRRRPRLAFDASGAENPAREPGLDGAVVRFVDGVFAGADAAPAGVTVSDLWPALERDDGTLRALLERLPMAGPGLGFNALNTAAFASGVVLQVAEGVDAGRLVLDWAATGAAADRFANARVLVVLEAGARLELFERHGGDDAGDAATSVVMQAVIGEGASLRHGRLQEAHANAFLVTRTVVEAAENSAFRFLGLDLGGGLVRHDLQLTLGGAGAACRLDAAYVLDGRRHVDNHLAIDHAAPDTRSEQFFRGVLADRGRAVFNGRVHILPGADGADAAQSNANLLLSPHAEVDTKPELEIHADEVTASHGATVGQLDDQAVFYLRSRGLDEAQARRLLTRAFCLAAVERGEAGAVRDLMLDRLARRLAEGEGAHG